MRRLFAPHALETSGDDTLPEHTWRTRHHLMLAILGLQALVLLVWGSTVSVPTGSWARHLVPLVLCGAVACVPRAGRRIRGCAIALGLFTESSLVLLLSGGAIAAQLHALVMLALVASYEDVAALSVGTLFVVLQQGLIGTFAPHDVFGSGSEGRHAWRFALIDGGLVLAASIAMVFNWRGNAAIRRSERGVRRDAERYLELAGTAIVAFDRTGRIQVANATACCLLDRQRSDVIGADWIALAVPEEGREASTTGLRDVMAGRREVVPQYEHELVTASGERRLIRWTDVLTRDAAGRITGLLKSGLDITEQRVAELEVQQAASDLEILREIAHAVATRDDARDDIVRGVKLLTLGAIASLIEPTPKGDGLRVTATTSELVVDSVIPLGQGASAAAVAYETGEPFFAPDFKANLAVSPRLRGALPLSSALFQPVLVDGAPAGVLVVAWEHTVESLSARRARLVEVGAHEAAIAFERAAGTDRLRAAALTDPLTGVANRRAFDAQLADTLTRARQRNRPVSLALIDLNKFKELNDREGHEAGDRLLQDAAIAWQAELRPSDLLARLGGDEFAVILQDSGARNGRQIAERLRRSLAHAAGCGVGVVLWNGEEDAASLIRRGDQALYTDKAAGARPRIVDPARLSAVADTGLTAESHDETLDELSRTITWLLDVPVGLVSLIGADCLILAGVTGLGGEHAGVRETPISSSFCQHAVAMRRPLLITDARDNPIVRDNPSIREFGVVAYAGVPLIDENGLALGSLCAMDVKPRDWSTEDVAILTRLAAIATARLVDLQRRGRALPRSARVARAA